MRCVETQFCAIGDMCSSNTQANEPPSIVLQMSKDTPATHSVTQLLSHLLVILVHFFSDECLKGRWETKDWSKCSSRSGHAYFSRLYFSSDISTMKTSSSTRRIIAIK